MTEIQEHLMSWGCPKQYAIRHTAKLSSIDDPLSSIDDPQLYRLAENVSTSANWYHEQDAALAAMVLASDFVAISEWASDGYDKLEQIGRETGSEDTDEGPGYANEVAQALSLLADAVAARINREEA